MATPTTPPYLALMEPPRHPLAADLRYMAMIVEGIGAGDVNRQHWREIAAQMRRVRLGLCELEGYEPRDGEGE